MKAICTACGDVFPLPATALCPACGSHSVRRAQALEIKASVLLEPIESGTNSYGTSPSIHFKDCVVDDTKEQIAR